MTDDDAAALLQAAWDGGIRYFDTAPHYGLGLSERRLGRFLAGKPRDEFVVSTKVGRLLRPSPETAGGRDADLFAVPADVRAGVGLHRRRRAAQPGRSRCERLGLDRVDVLYLHDPEARRGCDGARWPPACRRVVALREEGLVDAVGVGSTSTAALLAGGPHRARWTCSWWPAGTRCWSSPRPASCCPSAASAASGSSWPACSTPGCWPRPGPAPAPLRVRRAPPDEVLARARRLADICDGYGVELPAAALQFPLRGAGPCARSCSAPRDAGRAARDRGARARAPSPDALWDALAAQGMVAA